MVIQNEQKARIFHNSNRARHPRSDENGQSGKGRNEGQPRQKGNLERISTTQVSRPRTTKSPRSLWTGGVLTMRPDSLEVKRVDNHMEDSMN